MGSTHSAQFYTYMTPVMMHSLVIINSGKAPTDQKSLRKAIIHGVNKASIIAKELGGIGEAVDRVFPKSAPYSHVELTPRWDYDSEKATMLNCPTRAPSPATAAALDTTSDSDSDDLAIGLGLGLGLGIPLVLALVAAVWLFKRTRQADADLKVALANTAAVKYALPVGAAETVAPIDATEPAEI